MPGHLEQIGCSINRLPVLFIERWLFFSQAGVVAKAASIAAGLIL
jgi:hypothetical protein